MRMKRVGFGVGGWREDRRKFWKDLCRLEPRSELQLTKNGQCDRCDGAIVQGRHTCTAVT